jgi:membrane protein DedA with SNARE-associated domain
MFNLISLTTVESLIQHYGYFFLLILSILEGPIVTVIAGFIASLGFYNIFAVFCIVVLGDIIGDVVLYSIGHAGRRRYARTGKLLGLSKNSIEKVTKHFDMHSGKTVFWGKITHSIGFAVLLASGLVGMPIGDFILYNFLGTVPKSLVLVIVGYYFGSAYNSIGSYIDKISFVIFIVIVLCALGYFFFKERKTESYLHE